MATKQAGKRMSFFLEVNHFSDQVFSILSFTSPYLENRVVFGDFMDIECIHRFVLSIENFENEFFPQSLF